MFSLLFHELKRGWCFYSGHLREMEDKREHWAFSFPINGWKKIEGYSSLAEVEIHLVWIANCTHFPFSDSTELCCLLWLIMHKVLQISRKTAHLVPCLQPPIQNNTDFQLPAKKKPTDASLDLPHHLKATKTMRRGRGEERCLCPLWHHSGKACMEMLQLLTSC